MNVWQAAGAGLVIGVAATMGIGAIGHSDQPVGPYFQVNDRQIVSTLHVQSAWLGMEGQRDENGKHAPDRWVIQLYYENGKNEPLDFNSEAEAKAAWQKLRVLLGVEQVTPPEK